MTKRLSLILSLILVTIFLVAFQTEPDEAPVAEVEPAAETEPTPNDGATLAVVWVHPTDPAQSALIAADDNGGLAVYDLSGKQLQYLDDSAISNVDLRYNFALGDESITLVAAGVKDESMINLYQINPDTRELTSLGQIETGIPLAGLCMYRSLISGLDYVFANSEDGEVEQWELAADDSGQIQAKLARDFEVGSETEACVADDELAQLYISEGDTGVWKYGAEPEDGTIRRIVDTYRGNISAEVEGLALYYADDGEGYLIASNQSDDNFLVYQRGDDNEFVGTFAVVDGAGADGVSEAGGLSVTNLPLSEAFPAGVFVAADDENTDPDASTNFKLVSWADIAQAMDPPLVVDPASWDQRVVGAGDDLQSEVAQAAATVETEAVKSSTDAADDPAIWIHPTDPTQSTIIGTNKQGGLAVYDLEGQQIQFVEIGRVNNVDLRYNFPLGGEAVALVIASNRNDDSLAIYKVNPDTRELEDVAAGTISAEVSNDVYGTCLYVSPATGKYYVIVNSTNTGQVAQFELADNGEGQVGAKLVRSFKVGSQTEGCVADDETGQLYIGEEEAGIWKYGAEPEDGETRTQVDTTGPEGHLTADVEGLALYYAKDGTGYLLASSQGNSRFVVYERGGDNAYVGTFRLVADEETEVDAVSGTDGIDVTSFPLGDAFPEGVFVAQDNLNITPAENQNFKLASWGAIANAFDPPLTVDTSWDPRLIGAKQ